MRRPGRAARIHTVRVLRCTCTRLTRGPPGGSVSRGRCRHRARRRGLESPRPPLSALTEKTYRFIVTRTAWTLYSVFTIFSVYCYPFCIRYSYTYSTVRFSNTLTIGPYRDDRHTSTSSIRLIDWRSALASTTCSCTSGSCARTSRAPHAAKI